LRCDVRRLIRVGAHGRASADGDGEVVYPRFANAVCSFDQLGTRLGAMLNDHDHLGKNEQVGHFGGSSQAHMLEVQV